MTWALAMLAGLTVLLWPGRGPRPDRVTSPDHWRAGVAEGSRPSLGAEGTTAASVDEVADALVLVALALRAGLDLTHALEEVAARGGGPVGRDLAAVVAAVRWGRPVGEAWTYAGAGWRPAALAWSVAETTGAAPAALLADAAVRLREGQERDRERRAARAGVLLVLPLGLGFLPAFACTAVLPVVIALAVGVLDTSG
ncbi:MAG: type II secretion system F family protein [Pedococcus sp.]